MEHSMIKPRRVVVKEVISLLSDWQWHDPYELNERYRISPAEALAAFDLLAEIGVLEERDLLFCLRRDVALDAFLKCRGAYFGGRPNLIRLDEWP